jgi:3-oxoacyl-[acyl-carrier protein] reductase
MNKLLVGKVSIVTGGTRGIGRAIAERLLDEGASVAICGRTPSSVERAVGEMKERSPGNIWGEAADVSILEDAQRFCRNVNTRFGGVDILVNNAGVGIFRSVAELKPEEWRQMLDLNLSGVYYCCHEALPLLKARGGGYIINIGSLAGKNAFAGGAGYNASKFGLIGFSEALMLDHRYDDVRVSCILPGSVATEFSGQSSTGDQNWKIAPQDIAEVVVSLVRMPQRSLVSRVEIRPSKPRK